MRASVITYLLGMLLVLIGERVIGGDDVIRWALDGAGVLSLFICLAQLLRARGKAVPDQQPTHAIALMWAGIGIFSLVLYALTTDEALRQFTLTEDLEKKVRVAGTALWTIVWLVGTLPYLAAERTIAACPVVVTPGRARDATLAALATALVIAIIFPLNYLASAHNKRWDMGYFKTSEPGSSTVSLIENLTDPLRVVLFFPTSSDVTQEIRTYFDHLGSSNLTIEYVDHALDPELAKELKVRENGTIAIVKGEGDDQQVETIKIGIDFDGARRNLKKLDEKVQGALVKLTRGKRTAYITVGHGEMYWKAGDPKDRMIDTLKKALTGLQFKVKELGVASGLAQEVPEDADVVLILGPTEPFLDEEVRALDAFRRRGGSLLVTLSPDGPDMAALLQPLGLAYHKDPLVSDKNIAVISNGKSDRLNIATNKFSTHESVTTLSRNSKALPLLLPNSGYLEELANPPGKITITVRSLTDAWNDINRDLELTVPEEKREGWAVVAAVTGTAPDAPSDAAAAPGEDGKVKVPEFRAVVVGGSTWVSDYFLPMVQGNGVFLLDTLSWLTADEAMAGTVNNEEDVKIQHTKEGQGWIFYGSSLLFPTLILAGGLALVRIRRQGGAA